MASQSPKYPTKLQKKGKTVLSDKNLDYRIIPRWEANNPVIDPKYVGKPKKKSPEEEPTREDINLRAKRYGKEINPVTGYERALSVLAKLEELALRGDSNAAKEFLNRTMGKIQDNLNIKVSQFDGVSDAELLTIANRHKPLSKEEKEMIEAKQIEKIIDSIEIDV